MSVNCIRSISELPITDELIVLSSKSTVHFKNASDGLNVELEVKGDWWDRSASITFAGRPVAHISRSFFNVRQIFAEKQTVSIAMRETTQADASIVLRDSRPDGGSDAYCCSVCLSR